MWLGSRTGALILAAALWGAAISGTKYALDGFGPITLLSVELLAAAIALWLVALVRGLRSLAAWRYAIALGLLEPCLAYLSETVGLQRTSAANASVIGGLEAALVVILAAVFLHERITAVLGLAVLVGLLGLVVIEQADGFAGPRAGDALVLGGALSAAVYTIVARYIEDAGTGGPDIDFLMLTAQQFAVAALVTAPIAIAAWAGGLEATPSHVAPRHWVAAVAVGTIGFGASFLLYNWAIALVEARTSAIILNLIPVFGLICAVAWLRERLSPERLAGAGLITVSVVVFAWVEMRPAHNAAETATVEQTSSQADLRYRV